jgi:phthiocerol/phenolphthiocerol synthesis type-I polyketide synthase A
VAGALTPAEGLKVIATRSRLMARLSGQGAMALLELDADSAKALIDTQPDVSLAVYASPRQSVIAGPPEQVDALIETVAAQDKLARRIDVDVASHHSIIDPVLPDLRAALADLTPRRANIPVISTVGEVPGSGTLFDAEYWAANLRNPVRFSQAVAAAAAEHGTFVEVSPHPVLTYAISDTVANVHHHSVPTLQRDAHDTLIFHTNLNATRTVKPPSTDHPAEPPALIPTTPWHHTRHWIATKDRVDAAGSAPKYGTLLGAHIAVATSPPARLWQAKLLPEAKPYPGFHRLHGVEVVPVSVLMQTIAVAAVEAGASSVSGVHFEHPVVLDQPRVVQVVADGESVTVSSRPATDQPSYRWVRHVSGRLSPIPPALGTTDSDVYTTDERHHHLNGGETRSVAELLEAWGVEGQPFDWSVDALRPAPGGAIADVRLTEASTVALLDAAVHVARLVDRANPRLMVPAAVDSVWLSQSFTDSRAAVEIRRVRGSAGEIVVDIVGKTPNGSTCIDIRSLRYVDVEAGPEQTPRGETDPRAIAHVIEWRPWQHDDVSSPVAGTFAVVGGADGTHRELETALAGAGYHPAASDEARYVLYLAESAPGEADIDAAVRMSTEVSDLVRLLAARDTEHPGTLWILTRGVREAGSAEALAQGALWGLARVIGVEDSTFFGGLIDLAAGDLHSDAGAVASALSTVLPVAAEPILALRDGQFLVPALVRVPGQPVREPLRCHVDVAYLITGGLGVLGLLMADWLADRGARRLILAGRTVLPPRRDWDNDTHDPATRNRIAAIRALEMRGVAVDVVSVDIGSRDAVQALVDRRDREGAPPIRGVIHAAGVTEGRLLADTREDTFRRVMWPKIAGGQALRAAFAADELDFLYLAATAGTFFGIPGQGAYAAANAYLDCLAHNRHHEGGHTVSLDWVAWRGLGFGSDAAIVEHELQRLGSRPIAPEEAFAAWEFIDSYDVAQAVMAPDTSAERTSSDVEATAAPARAWSAMTPDEIARELETGLRAILARELRIPEAELEVDRPFAELGLNSVMAMSIRREAERLVGVELSATMLWNHPTIASLTTYLVDKLSPQQKSGDGGIDVLQDSSGGVLDSLFDEVESTPASVDSGMS